MAAVKVTEDLKNTLLTNPHIEDVHFDKYGNHHFNVHKHKDTGVLYTRIKNQTETVIEPSKTTGRMVTYKRQVYEVKPEHEIVLSKKAHEVLQMPVEEVPVFSSIEQKAQFEKQAQEAAKLKAELEDLKKSTSDIEALKAQLAKEKEEKEVLSKMLEEKEAEKKVK